MPLTDEARARGRATAAANRARKKAAAQSAPINAPVQPAPAEDEGALFDVEAAPDDVFPQEDDSPLSKVFKKLGLKGATREEKEYKPVPSAKLTKAQQSLYDSFAPLAIQAFIVCAGWAWTLAGPEYKVLAPSEEVAEKIVAPLMRVYARTSKIAASLNPNHTDIAASMAALVGYAWTSVSLYQEIKREKAAHEQSGISLNGHGAAYTYETGYGNTDAGRDVTSAAPGNNGADTQSNGAVKPGVDLSHLTESERRAYDKLSRLRELDLASRARRSGRAG